MQKWLIKQHLTSIVGAIVPWAPSVHNPFKSRINRLRTSGPKTSVIKLGRRSMIEAKVMFDRPGATVVVGDRTFIGNSLIVCADHVAIGSDVLISWDVTIVDHDSHSLLYQHRAEDVTKWWSGQKDWENVQIAPVNICDKAWIGFGAAVLKGVTIGEGAVIAAKSVVTRDVAPWTLVAGSPARRIKDLPRPVDAPDEFRS